MLRYPKPNALFLLILLALVSLPLLVQGYQLCDPVIREPCQINTPSLICATYNYTLFNQSGTLYQQGNLTPIPQDDIYYFNITNITSGTYQILLCDGSTREITMATPLNYIATPNPTFIAPGVDLNTPSGIGILFFLLAIVIALIVIGFIMKVKGIGGWMLFIAGFFAFLFGLMLAMMLSILFGLMMIVLALILMFVAWI